MFCLGGVWPRDISNTQILWSLFEECSYMCVETPEEKINQEQPLVSI